MLEKNVESLNHLQTLLNGEAIAIHMYDSFIPVIKDEEMKTAFQDIRTGHRRHLDHITGELKNWASVQVCSPESE